MTEESTESTLILRGTEYSNVHVIRPLNSTFPDLRSNLGPWLGSAIYPNIRFTVYIPPRAECQESRCKLAAPDDPPIVDLPDKFTHNVYLNMVPPELGSILNYSTWSYSLERLAPHIGLAVYGPIRNTDYKYVTSVELGLQRPPTSGASRVPEDHVVAVTKGSDVWVLPMIDPYFEPSDTTPAVQSRILGAVLRHISTSVPSQHGEYDYTAIAKAVAESLTPVASKEKERALEIARRDLYSARSTLRRRRYDFDRANVEYKRALKRRNINVPVLAATIKELRGDSGIKDFTIDNVSMRFTAQRVTVSDPRTNIRHLIGDIAVTVPLAEYVEPENIRFDNKFCRVDGYQSSMHHPHVFSDGRPCLGDAACDMICDAISKGDLGAVVGTIMSFLHQVNVEDSAGHYVYRWMADPTANELSNLSIPTDSLYDYVDYVLRQGQADGYDGRYISYEDLGDRLFGPDEEDDEEEYNREEEDEDYG